MPQPKTVNPKQIIGRISDEMMSECNKHHSIPSKTVFVWADLLLKLSVHHIEFLAANRDKFSAFLEPDEIIGI